MWPPYPYIDPNPLRPHEDTDVNRDCLINVVDIAKMYGVVFWGRPGDAFCVAYPCL